MSEVQQPVTTAALSRRRLGSNTLLYGLGALLSRLASFIMLPIYTRHFVPRDYGLLQLLDMSVDLTAHLMSVGLGAAVMRSYFRTQDEGERSRIVAGGWVLIILLHALGTLMLFAAAPVISHVVLRDAGSPALVRLAALTFAAGALPIIPLILLQTHQRAALYVSATGVKLVVQVALNILFIAGLSWGVRGVLTSTLLSNLALGIPLSLWMLSQTGLRMSRAVWRELLRYAVPLQLGSVAMFVMAFGDRWFLEASHGLAVVGIYSLAYQFGFLVTSFTVAPFLQAWNPQRFQFVTLPRDDRDTRYNEGFRYFNVVLCILAVGIGIFCRPLLRIVAGSAYWSAADYVPVLVIAYMVQAWTNTVHFGIDVSGESKYSSYANWASMAAILIWYALLIPPYGAWGAAVATLLGFLVRLGLVYFAAQRLWPVSYDWRPIVRLVGTSVVAMACSIPLRSAGLALQIVGSTAIAATFVIIVWQFEIPSPLRARILQLLVDQRRLFFARLAES